jgi:hypothetical protein
MPERRRPLILDITEDRVALTGFFGCVAIITGSALTWASVPLGFTTVTVSGIEADGKLTLLLGVLALGSLIAALRLPGRDLPVFAALAGLGALAVSLWYARDVRTASAAVVSRLIEGRGALDPGAVSERFGARPGPGVWVVVAGGAAAALAGALLFVRGRVARESVAGEADAP